MWGNLDLNQGPTGYESAALTTELLPRKGFEETTLTVHEIDFQGVLRSSHLL